jgi:hypothetical protein
MPLRTASVLEVSDKTAIVALHEPTPLPAECELYFTFNCTVGRKCRIAERTGDVVSLLFLARIGAAIAAVNDNIVRVD